MEKKLYDACLKGDVQKLEALMREDELTLARISLSACFNQTPLHLACMLGHFEFAKSLLSYKPDFATRLDSQGRCPLHLASANGYANIVQLLLQHDRTVCQLCDEDGRTPLQLAVMNGQHESVAELIKVNSESCNQELGTALHLCVMYNRLNVLIVILESNVQDLSNIMDNKGNTILHSATALKRMQIIKYLVSKTSDQLLDVNAVNENGLRALDIIEQMPKDVKTMEIKELLVSAGALRAKEIQPETTTLTGGAVANQNILRASLAKTDNESKGVKMLKKPKKSDKSLLIAASVIAAMAYQAAISPPGGVASVDATLAPAPSLKEYKLEPAESLLAYFDRTLSNRFWIFNTISFMAALSVIFLYASGASPKRRFFIWIIRLGMWITLTSMTCAYVTAVLGTTPKNNIDEDKSPTFKALVFGLFAWVGLLFLAILVLVYRFLSYMVRTIVRAIVRKIKKVVRKKNTSQDATATFTTPTANIV